MAVYIGPEVQTVLWDFDGTLLNSFSIFCHVLGKVMTKHALQQPGTEVLADNFHGSLERSIRAVVGDVSDDTFNAIFSDFLALDNAYVQNVDDHLLEDGVKLARRLHIAGKQQLVVTDRHHGVDRGNGSPRTMVENSSLRSIIQRVICGDDTDYHKPDPRILGGTVCEPGRTVMIGDQLPDAQLALNLGCEAILVVRNGFIPNLRQLRGQGKWSVHIVSSLDKVQLISQAAA